MYALPNVLELLARVDDQRYEELRESLRGLRPERLPAWLDWARREVDPRPGQRQARVRERAARRRAAIEELAGAGLSNSEIAKTIGSTTGSVRMTRWRMRQAVDTA